jgi:hypothetical protein
MTDLHFEKLGLEAAFRLHREMLEGCWGYEGNLQAFTDLAEECTFIARDRVAGEVCPVTQIMDTFYFNQNEIGEGKLEVYYYLH